MIKICAFSDGHGLFPEEIKPFDLMLIAGDIIDLYCQESVKATRRWYLEEFTYWVNKLPFIDKNSKVVFIAGNHEVGFQNQTLEELTDLISELKKLTNDRIVYLQNQSYRFWKEDESLLIFGTPYCKQFGRWAYMDTQSNLKRLYSAIPEDCDILLTHDAPYGVSDVCLEWEAYGRPLEHIGNFALKDAIKKKKPKINIHGHLHSANHNAETLGDTTVYNVSIVNEQYVLDYNPLYLEL